MNAEAEAEIERLARKDWEVHEGVAYPALIDNLRAAMTWAYRDAIETCRNYLWYEDGHRSPAESNEGCAAAIESRLNETLKERT